MKTKVAKIYIENYLHNILFIRSLYPKNIKICVPVKAQAYGHGAITMAKAAFRCGVEFFAVATVNEGRELRENGIANPIVLLGIASEDDVADVVRYELSALVHSKQYLSLIQTCADQQGKVAPVHIKVDTGMGRIGCTPSQAPMLASYIQSCSALHLEGLCTHLCVSDSLKKEDIQFTHHQIKVFKQVISSLKKEGISPGITHCSNSGAVFLHPQACFDMIRPGIAVYGYLPNPEIKKEFEKKGNSMKLIPVMELLSTIVQVKTVQKDQSISYGKTWVATHTTRIATVPLGYADGVRRRFSPGIKVTIAGHKYPVVGRVCMDQCMVDIGLESQISEGDEVIFFGPKPQCNTADDLAQLDDTISYEILCSIGNRVKREYIWNKGENL